MRLRLLQHVVLHDGLLISVDGRVRVVGVVPWLVPAGLIGRLWGHRLFALTAQQVAADRNQEVVFTWVVKLQLCLLMLMLTWSWEWSTGVGSNPFYPPLRSTYRCLCDPPAEEAMNDFYRCREGRHVLIHYLRQGLGWLRLIIPPTHHNAAVCQGDVFKRLDAEGLTAPLALLGLSAQGTSSNIHPWVFCLYETKME